MPVTSKIFSVNHVTYNFLLPVLFIHTTNRHAKKLRQPLRPHHFTCEELTFQVQQLTEQVKQFQKLIFGSKHERFIPSGTANPAQLSLDLEVETAGECQITDVKKITYLRTKAEVSKNKKQHPGRMALPTHSRRETIVLEPEIDTTDLKKIGEEITEVLDLVPGEFYVKQYIRPK